jgi:aldehyde:ferredoxin oxidoreductase
MGIPEDAMSRILPAPDGQDAPRELKVGRLLKHSHTWFTILGSLGICARAQINRFYHAGLCARLYQAATGIPTGVDDLRTRADRAWTLLKAANVREGFLREQDTPPEKWFGENGFRDYVTEQPIGGDEVMRMVEDYYNEQGWDPGTGEPLKERVEELDLSGDIEGAKRDA